MSACREDSSRYQGRLFERNMPDGLDRVHHLGDVRHTSRCPQRRLVNRLHMHVGAIEHGEARIAPLEREEEIGPAQQNDLGALLSAQGSPAAKNTRRCGSLTRPAVAIVT